MKKRWLDFLSRNRFVLTLLFLLICGGGCMRPYRSSERIDLTFLGVDEYTNARLAGEADLRPGGAEPITNLYGDILVVALDLRHHHDPRDYTDEHQRRVEEITAPLGELSGLGDVHVVPLMLDLQYLVKHPENNPDRLFLRELLYDLAMEHACELILVYTVQTDAEVTDVTLTLGSALTLGAAPTKVVTGEAELEAVLMDARSGYIYALAEAEGDAWGMTNLRRQTDAQYREDYEAQRVALRVLVERLEAAWPAMRAAYP